MLPVLEDELGLAPLNVLFCGTHTHSAPVVSRERVNAEWLGMLEKQAVARSRLQEVVLKVGRGS